MTNIVIWRDEKDPNFYSFGVRTTVGPFTPTGLIEECRLHIDAISDLFDIDTKQLRHRINPGEAVEAVAALNIPTLLSKGKAPNETH